ncbi:hypothetical protein EXS73_02180 [Candidatus Pacearchaeota archaeon]|nr:hypothetical protein [Candidatus Pacearchaeota archaeon]
MQEVIFALSTIIAIAALGTLLAKMIRQPPIIAYIIVGVLVGPLGLGLIGPGENAEIVQLFAHIGVAFLLFIVGLNLDIRVFKELGKVATSVGVIQIALTGGLGFLLAKALGFETMTAGYIGATLAFSSTVVVVKMLSDKKEIDTLHGRIALGILIVQDIVAAIALMALPMIQSGGSFFAIAQQFGIVLGVTSLIFISTALLNKRVLDFLAKSQEALFLFGIAWALVLATLFDTLGFSLEIGALIAGMSLASSTYTFEITGRIKPLRDFFMVLFFVFFGSQLATSITSTLITQALIFSAFVILGKPLIVMFILKAFGYTKRTNFLASSSLAQISEFSLILMLLGYSLGHISQELLSLAVLIAVITIGTSSYSIYYAHTLFTFLSPLLTLFEAKKKEQKQTQGIKYDVIIFGSHRLGHKIVEAVRDLKLKTLIIDHNPRAVINLQEKGYTTIFGDAGEREFLAELPLDTAKIVISTISDVQANLTIQEHLKTIKSKASYLATAEQPHTALDLYKSGVDYVIIPHHLGGDLVASIVKAFKLDQGKYKKLGKDHLLQLLKGKESSTYN